MTFSQIRVIFTTKIIVKIGSSAYKTPIFERRLHRDSDLLPTNISKNFPVSTIPICQNL
jgi:hypothetical protein